VPASDTVKIYFLKTNTDTVTFFEGPVNAGVYIFQYNDSTGQFTNSYRRLYLSSKRNGPSAYCRFYGDVKFEP
jgi:hypothetical protein